MDRDHKAFLERNYRFQRHIYDLTREHYLLGRDTLIKGLVPPDGSRVLEIGCGTARNLVQIGRMYPAAQLYGLDLSEAMLHVADKKIRTAGLCGRIRLAHADATSFEPQALFEVASFERIVFSYALSMIPAWQAALRRAADHLSPNGSFHVVDFGQGSGLPSVVNSALRAWLRRFHVEPRDDLAKELHAIAYQIPADVFNSDLHYGYATYAVFTRR
jgi:S-adenosylmethionine-diacylgycerolhomoserine-N-methlytransferase